MLEPRSVQWSFVVVIDMLTRCIVLDIARAQVIQS